MSDKSKKNTDKIRCDACPVMCYIAEGKAGACDRYANNAGQLVRLDALTVIQSHLENDGQLVPFVNDQKQWDGEILPQDNTVKDNTVKDNTVNGNTFVTAVGAGTTYPDYKPAPFIVNSEVDGVDMVTVVTEGIFSYCGAKIKIDTDRYIGPERSLVRVDGEAVGHVTTGEYGSQMLSLGGVNHLTGGSKKEGRVTCAALLALCNREAVELQIDQGSSVVVQAGKPPVVDNTLEERMRVGCGSATVGMFASQWKGLVDEVVVVDDHITGVMSEHQAGKVIGWESSGIKIKGRRSTPGRYFQVAEPGAGWGGTNLDDPLEILGDFNPKAARPGQSLLMVSTTGEQCAYYELDEALTPVQQEIPERLLPSVNRIEENCEPALCSVIFMGGAGGSLRAGVTENPVKLTRSVKQALTHVTCGGAPVHIWPGGGITVSADVMRMPANSFGYVPTPALVAPIEFTLRVDDYQALGGHMDHIVSVADAMAGVRMKQNDHILTGRRELAQETDNPWPTQRSHYRWSKD